MKCAVYLIFIAWYGQLPTFAGTPYKVPVSQQPDEQTFEKISSVYTHLLQVLDCEKEELKGLYAQPLERTSISLDDGIHDSPDDKIWLASLHQPLNLTFFHQPFRLRSVHNDALEKYLRAHMKERQTTPTFSTEKAIQTARDYLQKVGYTVSPNFQLDDIHFEDRGFGCWTVKWHRYEGIFPYDNSNHFREDGVVVTFHERLGLETFGFEEMMPKPKSIEVKISREDAASKAGRFLAIYLTVSNWLRLNFDLHIAGQKYTALQIAAPELPLPWITHGDISKPPKEVYLCWMITFKTINSAPDPFANLPYHSTEIRAPDVRMYVDAATGEVKGMAVEGLDFLY